MAVLVLLRHGESAWNAADVFTGWTDVALSDRGERQARAAGERLAARGLRPDVVHTSVQRRAIRTAELLLGSCDRSWIPVRRSWRLNSNHYGALEGRVEAEGRAEAGEEQYTAWHRGYSVRPPLGEAFDDPRYAAIPADARPRGESLHEVTARLLPYWYDAVIPDLLRYGRVLVVSHGNTLRALVKHIEGIGDDAVSGVEVPNALPLCYEFRPGRPGRLTRLTDPACPELAQVPQAPFRQPLAHAADVQTYLSGGVPFAEPRLLPGPGPGGVENGGRPRPGHHGHAVIVGDDHVARRDQLAAAHQREVDVAEGLLHGSRRGHAPGPDREPHPGQLPHVPAAGLDDQAAHPARLQRGGEQLAEVPVVAAGGRRHDEDVAVLALLDGDMDHPVIAGRDADGDRGAGDLGARVDRVQVRGQQPAAALRLVLGSDAELRERVGDRLVGPGDGADDNGHAHSCQGSRDTWMTSSSWPAPPIALIARSTSDRPKV